jgi:hypothetical protein
VEDAKPEAAATVLAAIAALVSARPEDSEFQRRYAARIDHDPDLAIAHGIALAELPSRDGLAAAGRGRGR